MRFEKLIVHFFENPDFLQKCQQGILTSVLLQTYFKLLNDIVPNKNFINCYDL